MHFAINFYDGSRHVTRAESFRTKVAPYCRRRSCCLKRITMQASNEQPAPSTSTPQVQEGPNISQTSSLSEGEVSISSDVPDEEEKEERELRSLIQTIFSTGLNFMIVFVLSFMLPSLLPKDIQDNLGMGGIAIASLLISSIVTAVAFKQPPENDSS
ncbi:hypothetical protein CEUSTIGMA_g8037.t1 [Chlamydomonas eustigma]|uniref:Uncharacterized protein n=1 Tax=Chlamydomonas eustigma TaxID=1157962 RepID=A0A250XCJ8_9CHLO|nr:hypothetical protein CEUSTIGMA_g8037.t1 [Chlamydomonas eustigma]|eukprot:GAX80602.1 hypothetical protein CEUSTIGMA_g8037.t1 [Chlamydomonas eustigma]